jgi:leucyl-tRNA synthetase
MDTFFDSSWYFLRYCDNKNDKEALNKEKVRYWMPVNQYIGGAEHACMHLIYARFFTKALRDLNILDFKEPFLKLFNQGMLHGSDGNKMSKSLGNVINPIEKIEKFSADSLRFNLMSLASPDKNSIWSDTTLESSYRFLIKVMKYFDNVKIGKSSNKIKSKLNKTIKEFTKDIEDFNYNLAIIKLRALFDYFENEKEIEKEDLGKFLKILHPICPHITEEFWGKLGNKKFISVEDWPKVDESKIDERLEQEEKIVEQTIEDIKNIIRIIKERQGKEAKKIFLYVLPKEVELYKKEIQHIKTILNLEIELYAVNDKTKYDPENKSSKAKPNKPAIYLE